MQGEGYSGGDEGEVVGWEGEKGERGVRGEAKGEKGVQERA